MKSETVTITFQKGGAGKQNSVVIESAKQKLVFKAWEHGIIPHEMVHYGVESVFTELEGFIRLIGKGLTQEEIEGRKGGLSAAYIENLVGAFQYEMWGLVPAGNESLIQSFRDFTKDCSAKFSREEFFEFTPEIEKIEAARDLLSGLTDQWGILPTDGRMSFSLELS